VRNGGKLDQVYDRNGIIGRADVGVQANARTKKRRPVFARNDEECRDKQKRRDTYPPRFRSAVHLKKNRLEDRLQQTEGTRDRDKRKAGGTA
jgi:hypothetical protein